MGDRNNLEEQRRLLSHELRCQIKQLHKSDKQQELNTNPKRGSETCECFFWNEMSEKNQLKYLQTKTGRAMR